MTALAEILKARIEAAGPMTLADFMAECLMHPEHGYYTGAEVFGAAGDFTTAPEISQAFGELLGLCLAQAWLDQGSPQAFTLAELGPGRGTLMADVMRATKAVPGFHAAADLHLVEASPRLRAAQRQTVREPLTHVDHVADLPDAPLFLIANEFFDALPVRQFQFDGDWRERMVGLDQGALAFGLSGPMAPPFERPGPVEGDVVEHCPALPAIVGEIAARIAVHGGAALIVDYGDWRLAGDTFQAVRTHEFADPLADPGQADLTAHVDFEAIARAARDFSGEKSAAGVGVTKMMTQGVLLERLGITARMQALASGLSGEALESHIVAHRRLTHPQEMGNLFKAIALYPEGGPVPPGFDP